MSNNQFWLTTIIKQQRQAHYMYLQMDPPDNPLSTRQIQTGSDFFVEPYPNGQFGSIHNLVRQFSAGSGPTQTQTRNGGPELLLTLSRRTEVLGKIPKVLSRESEQCTNVTALSFATGPSHNLSERLPVRSNHDEKYYRWQQVFNGQYIKMSINKTSTIGGFVRTVITHWFGRSYA